MEATRLIRFSLFVSLFMIWIFPAMAGDTAVNQISHFSPAFPEPPFQYRGNQIAVLVFKTTPETVRKLVPEPLTPLPTGSAFIYFSKLTIVHGDIEYPYLEVAIGVPVMFRGVMAYYYPLLYLDQTWAVTGGREIWGYPKKGGDITFSINGKNISGTLDRMGSRLITFTFTIGDELSPDTPQPDFPPYCLKIIPSVERGTQPEVMQITSTHIRDKKVHRLFQGNGSFEMHSGPFDSLGEIPVLEVVSGTYSIGDLVFDYGEVIYDYLEQSAADARE